MRVARWAAAGLVLTLVGAAVAAQPKGKRAEPPRLTHPMQVVIVTDSRAGCEPNCAEWISAEGEVTADTPARFRRVFKVLGQKKLPIFISSRGGSVPSALAIGREIRKRGLDVAVERTIFHECEPTPFACDPHARKDGDKGRPEPIAAYCASACAFILAAGTERVVPIYGFVGVHEITNFQTIKRVWRTFRVQRRMENGRLVEVSRELVSETPMSSITVEKDPNYAPVRTYFTEMGIDTATIMPLLMATPHAEIHRMTPDERRTTRLVTRVAAGDELLPKDTPAAANDVAVMAKQTPAGSPAIAAPSSADVILFYPPEGDTIDIFLRLKSSGPPLHTDQFSAEVHLADGKKLTARSTGSGPADPLYATLANADFCALRRAGDLSIKVILNNVQQPGRPQRLTADLGKMNGSGEFAAKHCGK
jgi:hypothetical protein